MTEEQLIDLVKQYPALYDISLPQYRYHITRNNAWEEIAEQMDTSVEQVMEGWAKLRNCFTNALKRRRKKSGQTAITTPWKLDKEMEFLLPHVKRRRKTTELGYLENDLYEDDHTYYEELKYTELTPSLASATRSSTTSPHIKPSTSSFRFLTSRNTLTYENDISVEKGNSTELDETELFFVSMGRQLKKLPKPDQVEIKFQLHKLIHDAEMKLLNRRGKYLHSSKYK